MEVKEVVTAFLRHRDKILLVRRSQAVGTYRGHWSAISGYLESSPIQQAITEIREETGLGESDIEFVAGGHPLEFSDAELGVNWKVHPFLFDVLKPEKITLDWENLELRWIAPADFHEYQTVPALEEAFARCGEI